MDAALWSGMACGLAGLVVGWLVASWRSGRATRATAIDLATLRAQVAERAARTDQLTAELEATRDALSASRNEASATKATLIAERAASAEAEAAQRTRFQALAQDVLGQSNRSFLELAQQHLEKFQVQAQGDLAQRAQAIDALVKPIAETLAKVDFHIGETEKQRIGAHQELLQTNLLTRSLVEGVRQDTGLLTRALRAPAVRGRWGEMQLRRVVELADMVGYCDFAEQMTIGAADDSGALRPDLVIRLPGGKTIAVDAKAPIEAYLDATLADDDTIRSQRLGDLARLIREHVGKLGQKAYWKRLGGSVDLVVMFLPGDHLLPAALECDPSLIECGLDNRVLVASPITLIALLRAIAYGWREEKLAENAKQIAELGRDLHGRIASMVEHFQKVGRGLDGAVKSYNQAVGSFERRVLPQARRFETLNAATPGSEIILLSEVEIEARSLDRTEMPTLAS